MPRDRLEGLEAELRSEIWELSDVAVILLGSKRHLLRERFKASRWISLNDEHRYLEPSKIGKHVADLIEDMSGRDTSFC